MSFAESIHNLGIIEEFFRQHFPQLYPFKPEDLLYSPACLKSNVLAMLGELFYTCEVSKPQHLKEVQEQGNSDGDLCTTRFLGFYYKGPSSRVIRIS